MKLLFLPIDIDLKGFEFQQMGELEHGNLFNPWWNATFIKEETIIKNDFNLILDQLPFKQITRLFHKTQKSAVGSHVDVMPQMQMEENEYDHIKKNEPCGYRIVLKGGTDKVKIKTSSGWVTSILPSVPSCYIINSTEAFHTVDFDEIRETIYIRGFLDIEKHHQLVEKSLLKYKDYAIYG
jgi:hypothetical protein